MEDYPETDFPWNFYFNGELLPRWGACWGLARIASHLQIERDADQDVGDRDTYLISCRIDHVGLPESADPEVFIYAVQDVLKSLLTRRDSILADLGNQSLNIYQGLVDAAFRMRQLTVEQGRAFWTSGYEADRLRLVETMRRCQLPTTSPDFWLPPHVERQREALQWRRAQQVRELHQLAQAGHLDKETRGKLHKISVG